MKLDARARLVDLLSRTSLSVPQLSVRLHVTKPTVLRWLKETGAVREADGFGVTYRLREPRPLGPGAT